MLAARILLVHEIALVLRDLHRRRRYLNNRRNRIIFRLSCCCGLRCCEIAGLDLGDVFTDGPKPLIHVRKAITKGQEDDRQARDVPLWWDAGTLKDIQTWKAYRLSTGAGPNDPLVCTVSGEGPGARLCRRGLFARWRSAIAVLGRERVRQLSIHKGRHSFISHALDAGRSLREVMDAAGHLDPRTTAKYMHLLEREGTPDIFGERLQPRRESCPSPEPSSSTTTKAS